MDTRKLYLEDGTADHEMDLKDDHGKHMGTVWHEGPEVPTGEEMAFGVELVKRYNTYPELVAKLDELDSLHVNDNGEREVPSGFLDSVRALLATLQDIPA